MEAAVVPSLSKEELLQEENDIDARLQEMGANPADGYLPPPLVLPALPDPWMHLVRHPPRHPPPLRNMPSSMLDIPTAIARLQEYETNIDQKNGEYVSNMLQIQTLTALFNQKPQGARGVLTHDQVLVMSQISSVHGKLVELQREIFQLQRHQANFMLGKRLVDEKKWWREYDELWKRKLEIQRLHLFRA